MTIPSPFQRPKSTFHRPSILPSFALPPWFHWGSSGVFPVPRYPQALEGAQHPALRALRLPPTHKLAGKAMNPSSNDRQWFRTQPERLHRCRVATPTEIEGIRSAAVSTRSARLADDCFIYAPSRINRKSGDLHRLFVVLSAGRGWMTLNAIGVGSIGNSSWAD